MIRDPLTAALVHGALEYAGIGVGVALYRHARRAGGEGSMMAAGSFAIVVGLLLGAGIGNKLVFLIERPDVWRQWLAGEWVPPGQSIVGGLLGGLLGVETAKVFTGQTRSTGDLMVVPIAVGLAVGRVGCFLAGLHDDTYGVATHLPWGVDFGDGIARHPTQLYEIGVVLAGAAGLTAHRGRWQAVPGTRFKLFLAGYLLWRLLVEGLKPVLQPYALGWSGIQWVCLAALVAYAPFVWRALCEAAAARAASVVRAESPASAAPTHTTRGVSSS